MNDNYLDTLYEILTELAGEQIIDGVSADDVSAIFIRIGLEIHRTANSEQEYNDMVDYISEHRDDFSVITADQHLH